MGNSRQTELAARRERGRPITNSVILSLWENWYEARVEYLTRVGKHDLRKARAIAKSEMTVMRRGFV